MAKLLADAASQNPPLDPSPQEVFSEACTAHNTLLTFKGCVPATGVFGIAGVVDMFDCANDSCDAASLDPLDRAEKAIRLRLAARIATLRTVVEDRIARASRTHQRSAFRCEAKVGDIVDMFRRPAAKDLPGWRGPCTVIYRSETGGTAVVMWQGRPWLMALRHLRNHQGYVGALSAFSDRCASSVQWISRNPCVQVFFTSQMCCSGPAVNTYSSQRVDLKSCLRTTSSASVKKVAFDLESSDTSAGTLVMSPPLNQCLNTDSDTAQRAVISLMHLMDKIDGQTPHKVLQFGKMYDSRKMGYVFINTLSGSTDGLMDKMKEVSKVFVHDFFIEGMVCGTQSTCCPPVQHATAGHLCVWKRSDRSNHIMWQIQPAHGINLKTHLNNTTINVEDSSFFIFYTFNDPDDNDYFKDPDYDLPDTSDVPMDSDPPHDRDMSRSTSSKEDNDMPDRYGSLDELPQRHQLTPSAPSHPSVAPSPGSSDKDVEMRQLLERLKEMDEQNMNKNDDQDMFDDEHDPNAASSGNAGSAEPLLPVHPDHDLSPTPTLESDLPFSTPTSSRRRSPSTPPSTDTQETIPYQDSEVLFHENLLNFQRGGSSGSSCSIPTFHTVSGDPQSVYQCLTGEVIFRVGVDTDSLAVADLRQYEDQVNNSTPRKSSSSLTMKCGLRFR